MTQIQQFDVVETVSRGNGSTINEHATVTSQETALRYTLRLSLSLFHSLPPDVPKFFQLRIIIFPGMSRRCFPTPSSARRLSRENSFRGFLSRTQPCARFLPHPFPSSSTQKNFNSAPEKSQMTTCFFFAFSRSLAQISYFKETACRTVSREQ